MTRKNTHPGLREIQYGAWFNEEYGRLVENVYREQAARTIQAIVRKNREKLGKSVSKPKTEAFITGKSNRLFAIREPVDNKYQEHAEKIKQGKYLELDYKDPEFIRNLFKALRLNEINQNQMLMAHSICQAKEWLHDYDYPGEQLHEFEFTDSKGPYQASEISYANKEQIEKFHNTLILENQKYVTINFSNIQEYLFFTEGLTSLKDNTSFQKLLDKYIGHLALSETERQSLQQNTKSLFPDLAKFKMKIRETFIRSCKNLLDQKKLSNVQFDNIMDQFYYSTRTSESVRFLIAILAVSEENPSVVCSPDYDEKNPQSPTIAFVLTTMESEKQLQLAVHNEEATLPTPTAGLITTRMIRALDEQPKTSKPVSDKLQSRKRKLTAAEIKKMREAPASEILQATYGRQYETYAQQARPVEIPHPDLSKTDKPHGNDSADFLLTWHDRFHCWRNGANFKKFIRHERNLFTKKGVCQSKDFVMNKALWTLSDMDIGSGRMLRIELKNNGDLFEFHLGFFFLTLIERISKKEAGYEKPARNVDGNDDLFLMQFIDMVKNHAVWDSFMSELQADKSKKVPSFSKLVKKPANQSHWKMVGNIKIAAVLKTAFEDKNLVAIIEANKDKPNESIMLRCKLRNVQNSAILCDAIDKIGIEKFFYWGMNSGLYFQENFRPDLKKYFHLKQFDLDDLDENQLTLALLIACKQYLHDHDYKELLKSFFIVTEEQNDLLFLERQYALLEEKNKSRLKIQIRKKIQQGLLKLGNDELLDSMSIEDLEAFNRYLQIETASKKSALIASLNLKRNYHEALDFISNLDADQCEAFSKFYQYGLTPDHCKKFNPFYSGNTDALNLLFNNKILDFFSIDDVVIMLVACRYSYSAFKFSETLIGKLKMIKEGITQLEAEEIKSFLLSLKEVDIQKVTDKINELLRDSNEPSQTHGMRLQA